MRTRLETIMGLIGGVLLAASGAHAQDWPQWRGVNRDAKAAGFTAPTTWPKELTKKWSVTVGEGVSSPALVGDKLFVYTREGGDEVLRCLEAATGKETWQEKFSARAPARPGSGFNNEFVGPRSSPAVADGKVVTLGVQGTLSCIDAASGKVVWRKENKGAPRFSASSSPLVADGLCIVQFGGEESGGIAAYDLTNGDEKWKWTGDGSAYASPVLDTFDGMKAVIAETSSNLVALNFADGKLLWRTLFAPGGMGGGGRAYNACTPVVDGPMILCSGVGRGTKAFKIEKEGNSAVAKEMWSNSENAVQFNSPILKNGMVYGITSGDKLFCINAQTGKTAWSTSLTGKRGYGSVLDAGAVLFALTPSAELIAFEPTDKEFKQLAKYKVGSDTYAYPVISGNRVFVKDKNAVTLWTIE